MKRERKAERTKQDERTGRDKRISRDKRTSRDKRADKILERMCWEQAGTLSPDPVRKEQALEAIRRAAAQKKIQGAPAWWDIVIIELKYISPLFWTLQGVFLIGLLFLLERIYVNDGVLADYLQWASVAAAWLGVLVYGNFGRHFFRGMAELEQSCYFNLSQMWAVKMALAGTVDILILSLCCGRISRLTKTPFLQVILYLLVPFVLSNVCCLLLFTALRGGRSRYGQLVRGFLTGLIALVPAVIPRIYEVDFLWVWLLMLFAGMAVLAWQIVLMYEKIERGEVLCWN